MQLYTQGVHMGESAQYVPIGEMGQLVFCHRCIPISGQQKGWNVMFKRKKKKLVDYKNIISNIY